MLQYFGDLDNISTKQSYIHSAPGTVSYLSGFVLDQHVDCPMNLLRGFGRSSWVFCLNQADINFNVWVCVPEGSCLDPGKQD